MTRFLLVYRFASAWREGIRKMLQRIFTAIVAAMVAVLFVVASVSATGASKTLPQDGEYPYALSALLAGWRTTIVFDATESDH
jgi:uncharacterized membrane protein YkvI